jgi:hypothetical protein
MTSNTSAPVPGPRPSARANRSSRRDKLGARTPLPGNTRDGGAADGGGSTGGAAAGFDASTGDVGVGFGSDSASSCVITGISRVIRRGKIVTSSRAVALRSGRVCPSGASSPDASARSRPSDPIIRSPDSSRSAAVSRTDESAVSPVDVRATTGAAASPAAVGAGASPFGARPTAAPPDPPADVRDPSVSPAAARPASSADARDPSAALAGVGAADASPAPRTPSPEVARAPAAAPASRTPSPEVARAPAA